MTTTIQKARAFAKRILSQREKQEEQVITDEMLAHMNQRVELQAEITAAEQKAKEQDAQEAAWMNERSELNQLLESMKGDPSKSYERQQANQRLSEISRLLSSFTPSARDNRVRETPQDRLVESCRDETLKAKLVDARNALESASGKFSEAQQENHATNDRAYKADNDRQERLGNFRSHYGDRFESFTDDSGDVLTRTFDGGVDSETVKFMNEDLARFNRIIRNATYTDTTKLEKAVEEAQDRFDRTRQAMIRPEV